MLVVGGLQGCEVETTSGNLMAPDLVDETDIDDVDSGTSDTDTAVDSSVTGNLMPPDVDEVDTSDSATATTDTAGSEQ